MAARGAGNYEFLKNQFGNTAALFKKKLWLSMVLTATEKPNSTRILTTILENVW